MAALNDITGLKFGRLTVQERDPKNEGTRARWRCLCECGGTCIVAGKRLRNGTTRSCGCLVGEWASKMGADRAFLAKRVAKTTKHGHGGQSGNRSVEYKTWLAIKRRCSDVSCKDYPNWGGRGIQVSAEWESSFEAFLRDMGLRPSSGHSIDRRDPNGHYCRDNCRWVKADVQAKNRRNVLAVTVDGIQFESVQAACLHFGVGVTTAWYRIRSGIDPAIAVSSLNRVAPRRTRESYLRKDLR